MNQHLKLNIKPSFFIAMLSCNNSDFMLQMCNNHCQSVEKSLLNLTEKIPEIYLAIRIKIERGNNEMKKASNIVGRLKIKCLQKG